MSTSTLDYYAREADRIARGPQLYGGNAAIVELRCFKYYHPDSGSWINDMDGKPRWLGAKGQRIWAIVHREAGAGLITMTSIAKEAGCCVSTVSRTITRLQAWSLVAVDVTRGRGGGIKVRLVQAKGQFRAYAAAAWARIRSWINVASRSSLDVDGPEHDMGSTGTPKDATFTEAAALERLGARVLAGEISVDTLSALNGRDRRRAREEDQRLERYRSWAREVIAERQRLDRDEPDWDFADLR